MKRSFLWLTWGLLSLTALLAIGYKSIASEISNHTSSHERPVIIDPAARP